MSTLPVLSPIVKGSRISAGRDADRDYRIHACWPTARPVPLNLEHVITCTDVDPYGVRHMLCVCGARYAIPVPDELHRGA